MLLKHVRTEAHKGMRQPGNSSRSVRSLLMRVILSITAQNLDTLYALPDLGSAWSAWVTWEYKYARPNRLRILHFALFDNDSLAHFKNLTSFLPFGPCTRDMKSSSHVHNFETCCRLPSALTIANEIGVDADEDSDSSEDERIPRNTGWEEKKSGDTSRTQNSFKSIGFAQLNRKQTKKPTCCAFAYVFSRLGIVLMLQQTPDVGTIIIW